MNNENEQPLSTQGETNEQEDQLGGTTNLSLDQLKQEKDAAYSAEDNPDGVEDQDDLHEIQAADDLGEPNTEEYQPDIAEDDEESDEDEAADGEEGSSIDADGNGGYPDAAINSEN